MVIRWIASNLSSNGQKLPIAFEGSALGYVGWQVLMYISIITIVGWAWVITAWMRWICRNMSGTRREVIFICVGPGSAVANHRVCDRLRLHHSHSVGIALVRALVRVAIRAGRPDGALARTRARGYLRWRTEPSWATDATSVPSGLKIRPRVNPRPSCALGESCA